MEGFVLPILPEGSLSSSVVTTVWIGVMVLGFFHLRFGWTLSGLVTPGYMVPLLMVKPLAAVVVFAEAFITYGVVWLFSQKLSLRWGKWSNYFGRDRFFGLVLASIVVKVILDGYVLPWIARLVQERWALQIDLGNNLHSFGLIIVALIANQFWKPGFVRGLWPLVVTIAVTYFIVAEVFLRFTNFSIGSLEYMYEDVAVSVLASPKAYIVLLITAYLASRMNLTYAWDYNGILIPSLLALQWYAPMKVATSLVEAWLVYLLGGFILRLPFLKESTVEGARKVMLFFTISYVYKLLIAVFLGQFFPAARASDFFGFGYLLPSLMAMKMHDKGIPLRLTRTTLQTSFSGAVLSSVVGLALAMSPHLAGGYSVAVERGAGAAEVVEGGTFVASVREEKLRLYAQSALLRTSPMGQERDAFATALEILRRASAGDSGTRTEEAAVPFLVRAGYRLLGLEDGCWCICEGDPRHGWGFFVVRSGVEKGILVDVPSPLGEWATLEAGAFLFRSLGARALRVETGRSVRIGVDSREDVEPSGTFSRLFREAFGQDGILEVRGWTESTVRVLKGVRVRAGSEELESVPTGLWLRSQLPGGLRLAALKDFVSTLEVEWNSTGLRAQPFDRGDEERAELFLSRGDRKRMLARFLLGLEGTPVVAGAEPVEDTRGIRRILLELKESVAERGTNAYEVPSLEALLYLDQEVLTPLLAAARRGAAADTFPLEIEAVRAASSVLGYTVRLIGDGSRRWALLEETPPLSRRWGSYVFRIGPSGSTVVEVPRPVFEENTLEYGVSLLERLDSRSFLVAGAHPKCNTDGSADVVLPQNKGSLFNLVNQVVLREAGDVPMLVIQVRASGPRPAMGGLDADVFVSLSSGAVDRVGLDSLAEGLLSVMESEGLVWRFVDGGQETVGYEAQGSVQAQYLSQTRQKEFASLWLSPFVRLGYREFQDRSQLRDQLSALGLAVEEEDLRKVLVREPLLAAPLELREFLAVLRQYRQTQDINALHALTRHWPGYSAACVLDRRSRKAFIVFRSKDGLLPLAASLAYGPVGSADVSRVSRADLTEDRVRRFVDASIPVLLVEGHP